MNRLYRSMLHAVGILDDSYDSLHRDVEIVIDDDVIEYNRTLHVFLCRSHLAYGDREALSQLPVGFRPTLSQPLDQGVRRWRNDENAHRRRARVHRPNLPCSLHLALQRAVQLPRVLRPLQELAGIYPALNLRAGQEVIRFSFAFPWPGLARCCRHRISERVGPPMEQLPGDRRLAAAGGGGEDHDARRQRHSRFSSCSRNFSSSPFMAITAWAITASFALDPIVFTSRNSSCARNPSCLPTAPSPASASRHAPRWVRSRTSSSVMSTRSASRATSTARRCSSTGTPAASSVTAFFRRASSASSRSGARRSTARAPSASASSRPTSSVASAAPSRARTATSCCAARSTIGCTSFHSAAAPSRSSARTSGCRATNARSTPPLSFSCFFNCRAAAST